MGYNYCKDHRSGITYVYEMTKSTDESTGETRTVRRLAGKLDDEGNIVPTSGRRGRLPKKRPVEAVDGPEGTDVLRGEIEELKGTIALLRKNQQAVARGLEDLLRLARG